MQETCNFNSLENRRTIESRSRKDRWVGRKRNRRSRTTNRTLEFLQLGFGQPLSKFHFVLSATSFDDRNQFFGQRVHDRRTHTVQTARGFVVVAIEFSTRVEDRQHRL